MTRLTEDIVRRKVLEQEPPGEIRRVAAQHRLGTASLGDEPDGVFKVLRPIRG